MTYSYFADPMYVFMDAEYNQYEVEKDNMGDALNYLEDGLPCEGVLRRTSDFGEMPNSVVREITYTEPAVRGDTSGKVLKPANLLRIQRAGAAVLRNRRQDRNRHAVRPAHAGVGGDNEHGARPISSRPGE